MDLDAKERTFLDDNFKLYGGAWAGGLTELGKSFEIAASKTSKTFDLRFTTRGPERVTFPLTVTKPEGRMTGESPLLPDGPALDAAGLVRVDESLRLTKELWLIERNNDELLVKDTTRGLEALRLDHSLDSRRLGDVGVLYLREDDSSSDLFCVATNLTRGEIIAARWVDLPANASRLLDPKTVDFLDGALKKYGDFGVYGDVTEGIRALARIENFELQIHDGDGVHRISLRPKDGHGHFLYFDVDATTGRIDGCIAGH